MALIRGQPAQPVQRKPFDFGASMAGAAPTPTLGRGAIATPVTPTLSRGGIPAPVSPTGPSAQKPIPEVPPGSEPQRGGTLYKHYPKTFDPVTGEVTVNTSTNGWDASHLSGYQPQPPPQGVEGINAPAYQTAAESYKSFDKSLLPTFNPISSFGDEYYDNLFSQAQKRLNDQYFGANDSLQARQENQMNSRGLVGSGIEQGGFSDLLKNFGSQVSDVSSSLATERAKNDIETSKYNTTLENQVKELILGTIGDESKRKADYEGKIFDSRVKDQQNASDEAGKIRNLINDMIGNPNVATNTKGYLQDLISSDIGSFYDISRSDYETQKLAKDNGWSEEEAKIFEATGIAPEGKKAPADKTKLRGAK